VVVVVVAVGLGDGDGGQCMVGFKFLRLLVTRAPCQSAAARDILIFEYSNPKIMLDLWYIHYRTLI